MTKLPRKALQFSRSLALLGLVSLSACAPVEPDEGGSLEGEDTHEQPDESLEAEDDRSVKSRRWKYGKNCTERQRANLVEAHQFLRDQKKYIIGFKETERFRRLYDNKFRRTVNVLVPRLTPMCSSNDVEDDLLAENVLGASETRSPTRYVFVYTNLLDHSAANLCDLVGTLSYAFALSAAMPREGDGGKVHAPTSAARKDDAVHRFGEYMRARCYQYMLPHPLLQTPGPWPAPKNQRNIFRLKHDDEPDHMYSGNIDESSDDYHPESLASHLRISTQQTEEASIPLTRCKTRLAGQLRHLVSTNACADHDKEQLLGYLWNRAGDGRKAFYQCFNPDTLDFLGTTGSECELPGFTGKTRLGYVYPIPQAKRTKWD